MALLLRVVDQDKDLFVASDAAAHFHAVGNWTENGSDAALLDHPFRGGR